MLVTAQLIEYWLEIAFINCSVFYLQGRRKQMDIGGGGGGGGGLATVET